MKRLRATNPDFSAIKTTFWPVTTKTWFLAIIFISLATTLLGGCQNPTPDPVQGVNLLVAVEGDARLKREGWSDYTPVDFGTPILHTDLLQVDGTISVLCGDLSLKPVSGRDNSPCPPALGWMEREGAYYGLDASAAIGEVRGRSLPDDVPYIQHPRNTLILDPHPLLRWNDTGATSYTVAIVQSGRSFWTQEDIVGNEMRYPENAPSLQPGRDYLLVVIDNDTDKTSSTDPTRGIGFQIVAPEHCEAIETHRDEILALSLLNSPARDFVLAVYYATWQSPDGRRSLWGEAWLLLESVVQTHDTPAVHLWAADVLSAMKLPDEAEAAYQTALGRAEALGDLESQAAAHAGLWRITGGQNDPDQALELYDTLGDEAAIEALREENSIAP